MFDIGSWEFLVIIVVALIVIGPKDLPAVLRTVREWVGRARDLAREFRSGLEEMAREVELDKVKDEIASELDVHDIARTVKDDIRSGIDPDGSAREALHGDDDWVKLYADSADVDGEPEPSIADPKSIGGAETGSPNGEEAASEAPDAGPAKPGA